MSDDQENERDDGQFPPTRWTLVRAAGEGSASANAAALDEWIRLYLPVLRRYLVGVLRLAPDRADDLVQDFAAKKILERRLLEGADPSRGRFRSFLLKCFLNFVRGELRKERAAKRGPPPSMRVNLDEHAGVLADPRHERNAFDALWARQALQTALDRMRLECVEKGREDVWTVFERRVLGPVFSDEPPASYERLVADLRLQSPAQASNLLITAKRSFRRALEETIRDTVEDPSDVASELAVLKRALAGPAG